ncbi:MAG: SDR family oxidoreductase [Promethearchaeota archaeon]|nr:MAG: SDR family oxidoreductase [Candidatus Lokiarchaeota archaeon]
MKKMIEKFLEGKGALITGGASGFGRGAAYAFAERGADVVIIDINEELLEETAKKVADKTGKKVIPIVCDVAKSDQVEAMAKQAFRELDNIYILFNNAGIGIAYGKNICRVREEQWDKIMSVNLKGQWLVAKSLWRKMKAQKFDDEMLSGRIICNASLAGIKLNPKLPTYSITKVGVIALAKLLAKTLAPYITVNSIAPGFHVTGIYLNKVEVVETILREEGIQIPLNRIGTVEDIVDLVVFLASPASTYITGQCIPVGGGLANF